MTSTAKRIETKSQLGELALDAAMALDGDTTDSNLDVVEDFLTAVKSQIAEDSSKSIFRDNTLFPVYSYALSKTEGDVHVESDDFKLHLQRTLSSFKGAASVSSVENLKQFCLAVHEALLIELMGRRISSTRHDERVR